MKKAQPRCDYCGQLNCICDCPMCERSRERYTNPKKPVPAFRMTCTGRSVTQLTRDQVKVIGATDLGFAARAYDLTVDEVMACVG